MNAAPTFIHKFGGWKEAEARIWINPDGSEGGIVATSATIEATVAIPVDCVVWPDARIIGEGSYIGWGASIGEGAYIGGGAYIGWRASIGGGAYIGPRVSIGPRASIGEGAYIGPRAYIGDGVSIGPRASIGEGAYIGEGASIAKEDWLFVAGPQGSRNTWTTAVFSHSDKVLRWWIGCQHGLTTEQFKSRLAREYSDGHAHRADYEYLISIVENHPGLARARAA